MGDGIDPIVLDEISMGNQDIPFQSLLTGTFINVAFMLTNTGVNYGLTRSFSDGVTDAVFQPTDIPLQCTTPPSACRNLEVVSTTDTTIWIRWTQPEIIGRSDFFYRILHSDPDNIGEFIVVEDNLRDSNTRVNYIVSGLRPFTSYQLKVTTHNGVSDHDPNSHLHQCLVSGMTREGRPSAPREVQLLCTVIVWQTPSNPNGQITGYDIEFSNVGRPTRLQNVNYYVTNEGERASSVTVKVRAVNGAGVGSWSPPGLTCPDNQYIHI